MGQVIVVLLLAALSLAGLGVFAKFINYKKTADEILIGIGMATLGFLVARLHLQVFARLFLRQGNLRALS